MRVEVAVEIDAPRSEVWRLATDIEGSPKTLSGVDEVEVLDRPPEGTRGLKWKETRTLYGKSATETMWVTDAEDGRFYTTEARSHGSVYRTLVRVDDAPSGSRLSMAFTAEPVTFGARVMSIVLGFLIRRSVRSALQQDLEDVKRAAEAAQAESRG